MTVVENPVINRIAFEGNVKVKDEQLIGEMQSKARGTLSRPLVQSDTQRIIEIYRRNGRYDVHGDAEDHRAAEQSRRSRLRNQRRREDRRRRSVLSAIATIRRLPAEGRHQDHRNQFPELPEEHRHLRSATGSRRIAIFCAASISSTASPTCASCRRSANSIPARRASSSPSPSKKATSTLRQCRQSSRTCALVDPDSIADKLQGQVRRLSTMPKPSKSRVEESSIEVARRGYPFASVRPRGDRDFETRMINVVFVVDEGARAYIERINIRGNTRTRDYVIRREFDIAEGDAYNRALIDRAERRLKNLELLQDREDHQRARLGARPRRGQCRRRRTVDRRILDLGRLFDRGRLPWLKSRSASATCSAAVNTHVRRFNTAKRAGLRIVVRRAVFPRLPHGARSRPLRQGDAPRTPTSPTTRGRSAARCGSASSCVKTSAFQLRYSLYQQGITLPEILNDCIYGPFPITTGSTLLCTNGEASIPVRLELDPGRGPYLDGRLQPDLQHARQQQGPDPRHSPSSSSRTSPASAAT